MKKRVLAMLVAAILLMGAFAMNVSAEATTAIEEWNIVLGDQIGANFYVNVPENTANAAVKVTVADQTETHELTAPNSKGLYKVSVNVAAAQMTEEITLQLVADGTEYAPVSYSIREYADHILKGNYSDDVKTMVKYMLNYGAAAQTYFGVQTENLANAGYKMDYAAQYPAEYPELAVEGQLDGVRLYGASLVMDSKVAVRYYFAADSVEGVTFRANGKEYAAAEKNDMFCVEIPGILPQQYGNSIVLSAQKGEQKLDVTYSPLTYMVRMSQKGSEEMKALVNAMYGYYEAAVAYTDSAVFSVVSGNWDLSNQYNGSLTVLKQKDGTTVKTNADNYRGVSVKVKEYTPSLNEDGTLKKGNFSAQISFIFDNGKQYQVRIHNTDDGNYKLQNMGGDNSITGWKWQADLTTAQKEKLINGDGVEFGVKLVGPNAELWVDGTRMKVVELGAEYAGKTAQISVCLNGNTGVENMEVPFALVTPTAPVQLNVAELTGGTVTVDSGYQVGDTIPVTVKADAGYSQKLYINGQPLLLGGNTNTYSFVATEEVYNITGSFAPDVFSTVKGNWSLNDQQHGELIITSQKDGTTVQTNASGYKEVSVTVKDHTPSKNEDGSLKQGNFSMQVAMIFDDGKYYEVRLHNTDAKMPNYKLQNVGGANNLGGSGWTWLADLTAAQKAKLLDGDGVEFAVKLVGPNAELWVDGSRMKVVELGAEYEGKLAQISLCMNGNKNGQNIVIPFELKVPEEAPTVKFNIPELANGTVTPGYDAYKVGETVTLAVAANAGYSQKLYINGEPLMLDWQSNTCSFVATEAVYNITGSFEPSITFTSTSKWNVGNQAHGVLDTYYASGDSGWLGIEGGYDSITVTAKNYLLGDDGTGVNDFAVLLGFKMSNGKTYTFRIIKQGGVYYCQRAGFAKPEGGNDWTKKKLDEAAIAAINGDGAEFKVERTAANVLTISVNGIVYDTYTMADTTEEVTVTKGYIGHYGNVGQNITMPFTLDETK